MPRSGLHPDSLLDLSCRDMNEKNYSCHILLAQPTLLDMRNRRRNKLDTIPSNRWAAYAGACTATALLAAPIAEAEIHYSGPINHKFNGREGFSSATLPLQSGAYLQFNRAAGPKGAGVGLQIPRPGGQVFSSIGDFVGHHVTYGGLYLSNLGNNIPLSGLQFRNSCQVSFSHSSKTNCYGGLIAEQSSSNGEFQQPGRGFIGFKFDIGNGIQYGWARIKTRGQPYNKFILVDYAWADPGEAISTGQKQSRTTTASDRKEKNATTSADAVPPALGLLAFGGAGVMSWRRRHTM